MKPGAGQRQAELASTERIACPAPAKVTGRPVPMAACRARASAMSLSLLVSIRSTSADSGIESTSASCASWPCGAVPGADAQVTVTPRCAQQAGEGLGGGRPAGSAWRAASSVERGSSRPSSAISAVTGARLSLTPIGCSARAGVAARCRSARVTVVVPRSRRAWRWRRRGCAARPGWRPGRRRPGSAAR